MMAEIEKTLVQIKSYAGNKGLNFFEYVELCLYPEEIELWLNQGLSLTTMKKLVDEKFLAYNKQRKYLSSLN